MALVVCDDCKARVSDAAKACPKCGYPMGRKARMAALRKAGSEAAWIAIVVLLLGIFFGITQLFFETPEERRRRIEEQNEKDIRRGYVPPPRPAPAPITRETR